MLIFQDTFYYEIYLIKYFFFLQNIFIKFILQQTKNCIGIYVLYISYMYVYVYISILFISIINIIFLSCLVKIFKINVYLYHFYINNQNSEFILFECDQNLN